MGSITNRRNTMEFVYVLEQGESSEGGWIVGLYNNEASALWELAIAFNEMYDMFKDWRPGTTDNEDMMPCWGSTGTSFDSGCDYWEVNEKTVED